MNMSAAEFRRRAEAGGATVRSLSSSEKRKDTAEYKADRKATDAFLNAADFNKTAARDSRSDRINNRANRRARRR